MNSEPPIQWNEINATLHNLVKADGGFSTAHRGIVTLPGSEQIFVKVGVDDNTRKWAKKEIVAYRFLKQHNYPFIPELLATSDDETSFALEPLNPGDGWDWSETWTKARLNKTLEAMDALAAIIPGDEDKTSFQQSTIDETDDGWQPLIEDVDRQAILLSKLRAAGHDELADPCIGLWPFMLPPEDLGTVGVRDRTACDAHHQILRLVLHLPYIFLTAGIEP